jgi:hypothetical protein
LAKFDPGEMKFPDLKIGEAGGQKGLGEIKPLVPNPPPTAPRPASPPVIPAAPVNAPLPPPSEWVRPGTAGQPAALPPKKPLPPPIRPRFGNRDQQR